MLLSEIFVIIILFWIREVIRRLIEDRSNRLECPERQSNNLSTSTSTSIPTSRSAPSVPNPTLNTIASIPTSRSTTNVPNPTLVTIASIRSKKEQLEFERRKEEIERLKREREAIFEKEREAYLQSEIAKKKEADLKRLFNVPLIYRRIWNAFYTSFTEEYALRTKAREEALENSRKRTDSDMEKKEVATPNTEKNTTDETAANDEWTNCVAPTLMITCSPSPSSSPSTSPLPSTSPSTSPNNSSNNINSQPSTLLTTASILSTKEKVVLIKKELENQLIIKGSFQKKVGAIKKKATIKNTSLETTSPKTTPDAIPQVETITETTPQVDTTEKKVPPQAETIPLETTTPERSENNQDFNCNMDDLTLLFGYLKLDDEFTMDDLTSLFDSLDLTSPPTKSPLLLEDFRSTESSNIVNEEQPQEEGIEKEIAVVTEEEESSLQQNPQSIETIMPPQAIVQDDPNIGEIQDSSSTKPQVQMDNEIDHSLDSIQLNKENQFEFLRQQEDIQKELNSIISLFEALSLIDPSSPILSTPPSSILKEIEKEVIKEEEIDQTVKKENDSAAVQQERVSLERELVASTSQQDKDRNRAEIESIYKRIQDDIAISRNLHSSARVNQSRATTYIKSFDKPVFKKYTNGTFKNEGLDKKSSPSPSSPSPSSSSIQFTSPFSSSFSPSSSSTSSVPVPVRTLPTKLFGFIRRFLKK